MDRIERVFKILNYLVSSNKSCGVTEISKKLRIDSSSICRILTSLEKQKWVVQFPDDTYGLGDKPLEFSLCVLSRVNLRKISQPYLIELNETTSETSCLGLRVGNEEIFLDQVECKHIVRAVLPLGIKASLCTGATGKAMLSYMDKNEVEGIYQNFKKTDNGVIFSNETLHMDKFLDELSQIRTQGFAVSVGERSFVAGFAACCVASPIIDHNNQVIASVSITGPLPRFNPEVARGFGPLVKQAAQKICLQIGSGILL